MYGSRNRYSEIIDNGKNNPRKIIGLDGYGLEVIGREPIEIDFNPINKKYLQTKRDKLGHFILNED